MVRGYHQAAATLNLLRAFTKGGFADLSRVHAWNLEFVGSSPEGRRYDVLAGEIDRALRFMAACGIDLDAELQLHQVDFYTSHEALLLGYEEALTRRDSLTGDWYDCSAHLLWVGERTRQLDGAHVEFLSGVQNPIGVKLGPDASTRTRCVALCRRLDPGREPGRLTLVSRMGADACRGAPPAAPARGDSAPATRSCGRATRCTGTHSCTKAVTRRGTSTTSMRRAARASSPRVDAAGVWPGGVHVELTGDNVTECLGGARGGPRRGPRAALRDDVRPPAERPAVARPRVPGRRARATLRVNPTPVNPKR